MVEGSRRPLGGELERDASLADAILDSLPGVFYLYDEDLHFLRWNREFTRVTGYSDAEMEQRSPLDFFAGPDRDLLESRIGEVFAEGESAVEADFVAKDGTRTPYYFTGVRTLIGGRQCLLGVGVDISARKLAEAASLESESRLRSLFDQASDGIFIISADNRYIEVNEAGLEMLGYTRDELLRMGVDDVLDPAESRRSQAETPGLMAGEAHLAEWEHVRKDGSRFPAEVSARRVDEHHYMAIVRDISERKRVEQTLRDSEERLRLALEAAHMGTFDWDVSGDHIAWSRGHEALWGFAPGEFAGTYAAFASRLHADDRAGVDAEVARCVAERDRFLHEFRVVWPDASVHWVIGRGEFTFDDDGAPLRMRGVVVETTERKLAEEARRQAEEALRESEGRFRAYVEQAADALFVHDFAGRFLEVNRRACINLGYTREELLDMSVFDVEEDFDLPRAQAAWSQIVPDEPFTLLGTQRRKDGSTFPVEVQFGCFDLHGERHYLGLARDISERIRAEQEIRALNADLERRVRERTVELAAARDRAEAADRVKSAFLATMSHELRTPLNSVIGFTGILLQELAGPLNDEQLKQLGMVRNSARHLLTLINDVLDLSKIEAGQLTVRQEAFDIRPLLDRVVGAVAPLAEGKGLVLRLVTPTTIGAVVSDERRVEQILLNLLGNAVKFTEQGEVRLSADPVTDPRPSVRFAVRDTGIGIKPEDLATLFQPFRQLDAGLTRQHQGTGLGLAICRRLADLLGGEIHADSDPGVGSTFVFTLPRSATGDRE